MEDVLDIAEVVRRTGLTARALRFYEARGLVKPLRTYSGRRLYGPGELERINQVLALKRAGLTLGQIQRLCARRPLDLAALIAAQLEAIEAQEQALAEAKALLLTVKSRIDRGEPIDVATFCSLISHGDSIMEAENWKKVADRYFSPEEQAHWAERMKDMPPGFDQNAYNRQWAELGERIAAALPLDPASERAQAFLEEWNALLAPFNAVATPEMKAGAARLYDRMEEWQGQQKPPFSMEVWNFIRAAAAARQG
ncbi:MAG TPA: MerR family transcriptional regulator [Allosphingosinicella sp.]|jgi:DNA-binding transcriptional MerR regulator|nr:MerR family transcriptional regulator [Allosphingosinicella sp.]